MLLFRVKYKHYECVVENHKITEQTSQRQRGNYVDFKIKDINEESGNVRIVGKIFQSESRVLKNGKTLVDFYIYDKMVPVSPAYQYM